MNFQAKRHSFICPFICPALAALISVSLKPYLNRTIVLVFIISVIVSAWNSGFWGGILATAISLVAINFIFFPIDRSIAGLAVEEIFVLFLFTIVSVVFSRTISRFRATEDRLKYALESALDGFWDLDVKSGKVYYSPRWISSLGYEPHEVPPRVETWKSIVHPEDLERTLKALQDHLEGRTPIYQSEARLRSKSGEWKWNLDIGKVVEWDRDGQPVRMVGIEKDISDRKKAEQEEAARLAAQSAEQAKDDFISLVSHELRNPLSRITMATELLRQSKNDPESVEFAADNIERATKMQLMLVSDLLDWSRLKSGKFKLDRQATEVHSVIEAAWDAIRSNAENKNIRLSIQVDPKVRMLVIDSNRMIQVFWNLLGNAVKFTPKGGSIQVQVKAHGNDGAELRVQDTGQGIPKEDLDKIFDRFWQSFRAESSHLGGLGLGLSIVREIVNRHHGEIHAESEGIGKGTTFVMTLKDCQVPASLLDENSRAPSATPQMSLSWEI